MTTIATQLFPEGFNISLRMQTRNYEYRVKKGAVGTGDPTILGLYPSEGSGDEEKSKSTVNYRFSTPFSSAEPELKDRKQFAANCLRLPEVLHSMGVQILDDQINTFFSYVKKNEEYLRRNAGKLITPERIKALENKVNAAGGVVIKYEVIATRVTKDNPKGSRKRSDGLYQQSRTVRSVFGDRRISEEQARSLILNLLDEPIMGPDVVQYNVQLTGDGKPVVKPMVKSHGK